MRALALAIFALLPGAALASGFYLPWWGEALMFFLLTPVGWACDALLLAAIVALIVFAVKRWKRRGTR
ncbi:hypothetical protein [Acidovorax sp. Leaf73]|uniref:hypothetical protein n=1 Tax=Acidovorax sp. Leaf73 TaxID=2876566 RepID=UPI001E4DEE57|nr:hypothetical protein [Acidovorax sp. Leaf73]